jgi:hypothetical protein
MWGSGAARLLCSMIGANVYGIKRTILALGARSSNAR